MATTIITPQANPKDSNNGMGFLLGVIALAVFAVIFTIYIMPYLKGLADGGVQVNLPNKIDVNVQQSK